MKEISIHSLFTEGDGSNRKIEYAHFLFQSTPSLQRETLIDLILTDVEIISIHSLFTEGDLIIFINSTSIKISIHSLFTEGDV